MATRFGYTLMTEQSGPRELVGYATAAEAVGFDFEVCSDGGGWNVNADLPTTAGFAAASQFVTPDNVADAIPCGPDLDRIVESVSAFWEAGFTDICLVQIGDDGQERFLSDAAKPLLEKLRAGAS